MSRSSKPANRQAATKSLLRDRRAEVEPLLASNGGGGKQPSSKDASLAETTTPTAIISSASASTNSPDYNLPSHLSPSTSPLYTLPIAFRPSSRLSTKWTFPLVFLSGMIAIVLVQAVYCAIYYPCKAAAAIVRSRRGLKWANTKLDRGREWTKVLFGQLLVLITVLYAPTSLTLTTDGSIDLESIIHPRLTRDGSPEKRSTSSSSSSSSNGDGGATAATIIDGIDLPENLVIMANHQAYLDWMYVWMLGVKSSSAHDGRGFAEETRSEREERDSALKASSTLMDSSGDSKQPRRKHHGAQSLIILLKRSLKWVPIVGWGMQYFNFIFMNRSWASDRPSLTRSLSQLATRSKRARNASGGGIWLLIFPEGTITSDEERVKSLRYANREGVKDFVNCLHPRATGLSFCLRTLRRAGVKDLRVLDLTIGYPGVPRGGYAQEWYNLGSVFWRGVSPPTVHVHMRLIDPRTDANDDDVPGVSRLETNDAIAALGDSSDEEHAMSDDFETAEPSAEEAKAFNLWLRGRWQDKEDLLDAFAEHGRFVDVKSGQGESRRRLVSDQRPYEIALSL